MLNFGFLKKEKSQSAAKHDAAVQVVADFVVTCWRATRLGFQQVFFFSAQSLTRHCNGGRNAMVLATVSKTEAFLYRMCGLPRISRFCKIV